MVSVPHSLNEKEMWALFVKYCENLSDHERKKLYQALGVRVSDKDDHIDTSSLQDRALCGRCSNADDNAETFGQFIGRDFRCHIQIGS